MWSFEIEALRARAALTDATRSCFARAHALPNFFRARAFVALGARGAGRDETRRDAS